jgi:RNA polymerase sigma-70 factor (ECF subfamily)
LHTFRGGNERSFLAWLRQIMMNRLRDLARREAIRPCNVDAVCLDNYMGKDDSAEGLTAADRGFLIRKALQIMQADFEPTTWRACWETVTMDRPAAEVADELGVSVDVVYSASYRVIRRLRSELLGTWQ